VCLPEEVLRMFVTSRSDW